MSKLEPGLFALVPPDLGRATEFVGNPYIVATEIDRRRSLLHIPRAATELHRLSGNTKVMGIRQGIFDGGTPAYFCGMTRSNSSTSRSHIFAICSRRPRKICSIRSKSFLLENIGSRSLARPSLGLE